MITSINEFNRINESTSVIELEVPGMGWVKAENITDYMSLQYLVAKDGSAIFIKTGTDRVSIRGTLLPKNVPGSVSFYQLERDA